VELGLVEMFPLKGEVGLETVACGGDLEGIGLFWRGWKYLLTKSVAKDLGGWIVEEVGIATERSG